MLKKILIISAVFLMSASALYLGYGKKTTVAPESLVGFPSTGSTVVPRLPDTGNTVGSAGPAGLTGATGLQGPAGSQGEKGDKGDTGDTGATGPAGSVALSANGGLTDTAGLSLLTSCSSGEILEWNGTAWVCSTVSSSTGVSSLNTLTGGLTIAGGGINSVSVLGTTITVTGTIPSLDPTYFSTANISQWTNNTGFITDGNVGWDNSYGFITASSADVFFNKTIAAGSNSISGLTNTNLSGTAGITDANLATISTANKVSGSAVQLNVSGGMSNSAGLTLLTSCANGEVLKWSGTAWGCASDITGGALSFSSLNSGTNTTAAMIIDTGASLTFSGLGTINATSLGGATFAAPGAIGSGTANTGAFTTLSASSTLTASNGLTMTTGALSLTSTSGTINLTGLTGLTQTLSSGIAEITAPTLNLNTASTGNTSIGNTTGMVTITSGTGNINLLANGTSTGNVQIGDGGAASATPDLLVLDTGTADPTGVNGATYYNTTSNKFRCYENGAWKDCDTGLDNIKTAQSNNISTIGTTESSFLSVSITPTSTTKNIWITASMGVSNNSTNSNITLRIRRGADCTGTQVGSDVTWTSKKDGNLDSNGVVNVIDSPSSVLATTYQLCAVSTNIINSNGAESRQITAAEVKMGADLAEVYNSVHGSIEPGKVVSIDYSIEGGVRESSTSYDTGVLGVISSNPGIILSSNSVLGTTPVMVALSGRVPVKVTAENGEIKPGDYLTSSSVLGVAMKATKAGAIIGTAMTGFGGDGVGEVIVFVKNGVSNGQIAEGSSAEILNNLMTLPQPTETTDISEIMTDRLVAGLEIITPRLTTQNLLVSGDATISGILYADTIKANRIEGVDILTKKLSLLTEQVAGVATAGAEVQSNTASEIDIFEVISNRIAELFKNTVEFIGKVIFKGDVNFEGRPTFNKDTAGFATIKAGGSEVEILFDKEYKDEPVVTATVQIAGGALVADIPNYAIADVSTKGFKIRMSNSIGMDLRFSWVALAVSETMKFEGSGGAVVPPVIIVTPEPTPEEIVTPTPTLSPTPTIEIAPIETASESGSL